jgi:hypothetical protein
MNYNMAILEAVNLKEARVERDVIPGSAFSGKKSLYYFTFPEIITEIGGGAFSGSSLSGNIVIPDQTRFIGGQAFARTNITSVQFSPILESIEGYAFENCTSLSGTLNLPESLKSIGYRAFYGCGFSGQLVLPNELEYLGEAAFCRAGSFVGNLRIPDQITELYASTFGYSGFTGTLDLNNVIKLNSTRNSDSYGGVFTNCGFKGELIIPEGTIIIPFMSFQNNNFSSVKLPSTLKTIESEAFAYSQRISEPIVVNNEHPWNE